ncbi:MAG TPA: type II secretion system protein, partial [Acidimicrobiales bacterium]|nr:type II secretion system protein [Acidimicrobiales bacterium]
MGKALQHERDEGFTLVEMLIALMIFAIVMLALAPAFYGQLKAAAATSYRSTANGLAVAAIEQMRSFPYYEIGYNQSDYSTSGSTALSCVSPLNTYQTGGTAPSWNSVAGLKPVELSSGSALDDINN